MNLSEAVLLLVLLALCNPAAQEPLFFKRPFNNSQKGFNVAVFKDRFAAADGKSTVVYYHDQTVAVIDLAPRNVIDECTLIEVYEPEEAIGMLRNLSLLIQPQQVTFSEMMKLMRQCELLDKLAAENSPSATTASAKKYSTVFTNPFSLLSGILPGTKWCGPGDIAENYHDLGREADIDRCCRTHDLCPVKVRSQQSRYNLTNYSLYTKSHCSCDERFYKCLKSTSMQTANVMGHIYFNIIRVPCIEDVATSQLYSFESARQFIPAKMNY